MNGSGSRPVISQPAAAFCIQVPIFETIVATQSTVKVGWRNGLSDDASPGGAGRGLVGGLASTVAMVTSVGILMRKPPTMTSLGQYPQYPISMRRRRRCVGGASDSATWRRL